MHRAATGGNLELTASLIRHKAEVDFVNSSQGWTPLHCAVRFGHNHITDLLLDHDAAIDKTDLRSMNPLCIAAQSDHLATVQRLIVRGAVLDEPTGPAKLNIPTALDVAHADLGNEHLVTQLLNVAYSWSELMIAVYSGEPERVRSCLRDQGNPHETVVCNGVAFDSLSLAQNNPCYGWSSEWNPRVGGLIKLSMQWTIKSHHLFPRRHHRMVWQVLKLEALLERHSALPVLPSSVWLDIIAQLPRMCGFTDEQDELDQDSRKQFRGGNWKPIQELPTGTKVIDASDPGVMEELLARIGAPHEQNPQMDQIGKLVGVVCIVLLGLVMEWLQQNEWISP